MGRINNESIPLVVHSNQLTISLLNINRSLTPYLFSSYIDELDESSVVIKSAVHNYYNELEWLRKQAQLDHELVHYVEVINSSSTLIVDLLDEVMTTYAHYLDLNDRVLYFKSDMAMLLQKVTNQLRAQSAAPGVDKIVIEQLLSQIGLIESQSDIIFSLKNLSELKPEMKSFSHRKQTYLELISQIKNTHPEIYSAIQEGLSLIQTSVFSSDGAVNMYIESIKLNAKSQALRAELEQELNLQLQSIESMSEFATTNTGHLFAQSNSALNQSYISIISVVLLAIFSAALISWILARSIKVPSRLINGVLDSVSNKNLAVKVNYQKTNELGQVANKINAMIYQLSEVINQLSISSQSLNGASVENQTTSDELSSAIEKQTAQILQVASAMEQIEHAVVEIANASNDSFSLVTNAVQRSVEGQNLMEENAYLVEQLSQQLLKATESIQQLQRETSNIGSILDVISTISDQTNLLALNAAIEAARAGEYGRGFAVVADEVRVLASRTTHSTVEIKDKIESLKQSAVTTVCQITECTDYMSKYSSHAQGVNSALFEVHQFLGQIEESSHQIAAATNQHKLAASEVTENVEYIHSLAQVTTKSAQNLVLLSEKLENMAEQQSRLTRAFDL
ncbi:methyl-accepting chemotaxis protein [Vibrio sp. MA40-2]|uniref:methyl-accepting chemotaxis protein n=1 Tax=Vibrio sp. MA40-2 TaxID=3391828 RepID=UPI0039A57956